MRKPIQYLAAAVSAGLLLTGCAFGIILSVSKEIDKINERKNELTTTESDN